MRKGLQQVGHGKGMREDERGGVRKGAQRREEKSARQVCTRTGGQQAGVVSMYVSDGVSLSLSLSRSLSLSLSLSLSWRVSVSHGLCLSLMACVCLDGWRQSPPTCCVASQEFAAEGGGAEADSREEVDMTELEHWSARGVREKIERKGCCVERFLHMLGTRMA
eukprot:486870-Rhodomonas_salina.2